MDKSVIIIGGHSYINMLSVLRSLSHVPYDLYVVACRKRYRIPMFVMKRTPEAASRYCRKEYFVDPDVEELTKLLLESFISRDKSIIIPTDDFSVHAIESSRSRLEDFFILPFSKRYSFDQLANKTFQKHIASGQPGLLTAEEWIVEVKNHQYRLPEGIQYPVYTKPESSIEGKKSMEMRCESEEEVRKVIAMTDTMQHDCTIMMEEYHEIDEECCTIGISDGENVFMPYYIIGRRVGRGRSQGVIIEGEVRSFSALEEIHDRLCCFIREIGFVGIFDIDFYKSGDQYFYNELNLRIGGSSMAMTASGVSFPRLYVDMTENGGMLTVSENSFERREDIDLTFVNERTMLDDWSDGYLTIHDMIRMKLKADIGFLACKGDMGWKMILYIGMELGKRIINRGLNLILRQDVQKLLGA